MKRLLCILLTLSLLAGCGLSLPNTAPAASAPEESSPVSEAPDFGVSVPEPSSILPEELSVPEDSVEPIPEPEPEPEPPLSLREILPAGTPVYFEGRYTETLVDSDVILIPGSALMNAFPQLTREDREESITYTDASGNALEIPVVYTDGLSELQRPADGGIVFEGLSWTEYWLPLDSFCYRTGMTLRYNDMDGCYYAAFMPDVSGVPTGIRMPVLMYHEVSDDLFGIESLFVSPDNMRSQLQYLYDAGYDPIFFSDLCHLSDYDKPVLLTFDDGYIGNYTQLFPLLREFNMKATIFVITGLLNTPNYLTDEMVKEMSDSGLVSIQSHTVNHAYLGEISYEEQEYELRQSYFDITRLTGKPPYVLSYPTGSHNRDTVEIGREYYRFGVKMNGNTWVMDSELFDIERLYISRSTGLGEYQSIVSGAY